MVLTRGAGRLMVKLDSFPMGEGTIVRIYNGNAHIGAVAVGEYDASSRRASTSVITRLGHKDDTVAREAARLIARETHKPVCVVTGIHIENPVAGEITELVENALALVKDFVRADS